MPVFVGAGLFSSIGAMAGGLPMTLVMLPCGVRCLFFCTMQGRPVTKRLMAVNARSPALAPSRRLLLALALVPLTSGLAGCANPFKKGDAPAKPTTLSGSVQAAPDLNPSVSQRPSPLAIRVYELRSDAAFNQADFMALYQSEQTVLGADLVLRDEFTLQPGETRALAAKTLNPDTRYIAVFAVYRNLERARWRAVVPVKTGQAQVLTLRAEALALSAQIAP